VALDLPVLRSLAAGDESRARALPHLLASLHRRPLPAVLVLDDVHELRNVEALHFIRALAANVPPGFHVVIGSRVGLGPVRPRCEVECVEFGPDDLAFSHEEAGQVLAGAGAVCSDQEVAALMRRTHGWPAAVHLAALASGAVPGEDVRIQLRAAAWDGQHGQAMDAAVHTMDDHYLATLRLSAPGGRGGSYPPGMGPATLTRAEMEVLELMPTHLSLSEIGDQLHTSRNTVKSHVAAVHRKLGCSTRAEVVSRGRDLGLLEPQPAGPAGSRLDTLSPPRPSQESGRGGRLLGLLAH
jgi:ATP/maltotriose-dependent transcriptional regulator MalT